MVAKAVFSSSRWVPCGLSSPIYVHGSYSVPQRKYIFHFDCGTVYKGSAEINLWFCLQKNHRSLVQTRLQVTHVEIVGIMKQTYEVFKHDGQEVFQLNIPVLQCFLRKAMRLLDCSGIVQRE